MLQALHPSWHPRRTYVRNMFSKDGDKYSFFGKCILGTSKDGGKYSSDASIFPNQLEFRRKYDQGSWDTRGEHQAAPP